MAFCFVSIDFVDDKQVEVSLTTKKPNIGTKGWQLYRKLFAINNDSVVTDGRILTSMAAAEWRKLTIAKKLEWNHLADNKDVCGNRWVSYV